MLLASGLPRNLWTEALKTAVHINNRSPTSALDGLTPHEKWFGSPPDIGYLRVFGCDSLWMQPGSLNSLQVQEPVTLVDALASPQTVEWQEAISSELHSMEQHGVWELVPRPRGGNIVGCRWVFKVKTNADGTVERYKARLVAQGFRQKEGVDYQEVFAPTIGHESIRCILSLAASFDMEIHHMDIKTAFLHGELEETVYMKQPPGFARADSQESCLQAEEKHLRTEAESTTVEQSD